MTNKFNYIEVDNKGSRIIESQIEQSRAFELIPEVQQFNEQHAPDHYRILISV